MGEAKRRGSYEQRVAMAQAKNELAVKIVEKNLKHRELASPSERESRKHRAIRRLQNNPRLIAQLNVISQSIPTGQNVSPVAR